MLPGLWLKARKKKYTAQFFSPSEPVEASLLATYIVPIIFPGLLLGKKGIVITPVTRGLGIGRVEVFGRPACVKVCVEPGRDMAGGPACAGRNRWGSVFFFFFKWLKLNSSMKRTCELISWWPSKSIHKRGPGEATGGGKCPVGSAAFPERGWWQSHVSGLVLFSIILSSLVCFCVF